MLKFKNRPMHECAPEEWRTTPVLSGDYDFDASVVRSKNSDVPARLKLYLRGEAYGPVTNYNGYSNYLGDD